VTSVIYGERLYQSFAGDLYSIFGLSLEDLLKARESQFWVVGIDVGARAFRDLRANVDLDLWQEFCRVAPFANTDAGMFADLQSKFPSLNTKTDLFLMNVAHLTAPDQRLRPLIIHEICHYLDQIKAAGRFAYEAADDSNAKIILNGLDPPLLAWHPMEWAKLLAFAGRVGVSRSIVPQTTVRAFFEAAIPEYDRNHPLKTAGRTGCVCAPRRAPADIPPRQA
jgi:hypothetical protein